MITIHTDTKKLIKALALVKPLTMPNHKVLAFVWLEATAPSFENDTITLFATDYESTLNLRLPANVADSGSALLPCAALLKILRTFPKGGEVTIRQDGDQAGGWINVESGSNKIRFPAIDPGLYPSAPGDLPAFRFTMDAPGMSRSIDLTVPFTCKSEARRNLMGVHISRKDGNATWTAIDGHRLGQVSRSVGSGAEDPTETIIPAKSLKVWRAALKWEGGKGNAVSVHYDETRFAFTTDTMAMSGRTIEGRFPNVDQIIPKSSSRSIEADISTLSGVVAGIAAMSSEQIKPLKLTVEPGQLTAESQVEEHGNAKQTIPVEVRGDLTEKGKPFAIGFNAVYMGDVLKCANGHASVRVAFNSPLHPSVWTFPEENGFLAVVMPLRLDW